MRFTKSLAVAVSLSLVSTPVLAQSAAPLALSPVGAQMQEASKLDGDNYLIPAVVIFGLLAAAILLSKDSDRPTSP